MRIRLRTPVVTVFLSGFLAAQITIPVTSLVDGHPAALRAALTAAASATAIIELRVAGNYVLDPARSLLPPVPRNTLVRAIGFGPGQRFTIDTRSFTVPVSGLRVQGDGARITAPLTVLVTQGSGVLVTANDVHVTDLEVRGATSWCFRADNAQRLVVERLVTSGGNVGVALFRCSDSRLGRGASGWPAQATGCTGHGLLLQECRDVTLEHFRADDNVGAAPVLGVLVEDSTRVLLGGFGQRNSASRNGAEGVKLVRCTDCRIESVDLLGSALIGCRIDGGSGNVLTDALITGAGAAGVQVDLGAMRTTVGPRVVIVRPAGGMGPGIAVGNCTTLRLEGIECSDCSPGISLGSGSTDVVIDGCYLHDCERGLHGQRARNLRVLGSIFAANALRGLELDQSVDAVIIGCWFEANHGPGFEAVNGSHRVVFGPGNVVERNGSVGVGLRNSDDCLIADNPSISSNDGVGIEMSASRRTSIRGNTLFDNLGVGIWLLFDSSDCVVGPGNEVRGTLGAGIKLEHCDRNLITGNRVVGNLGAGVGFIDQFSPTNTGHVLRSTLVADNRSVGVLMRNGNPVTVEACTITGNYRGLQASSGTGTRARIDVDSSILWGNLLDDYDNASMPWGLVTAQYSTVQRPAGTGTNDPLDPVFADRARGDYRLTVVSPGLGAANQGRYAGLGAGARDCRGGDRFVECAMDRGACELQRIEMTPIVGARAVAFELHWPRATANAFSLLLFSTTAPTGGAVPCSNFTPDLFTSQQLSFSLSLPGVFAPVPPDGVVRGTVPLLLPGLGPWSVWAAGFLLDARAGFALQGATGVARGTVR